MKFRNIAVGIVVGGVIFAGGVAAVAWQKGWSVRETIELGAGVIAAKTSRHTIADRTAAILAKKPQLKGVAESAGGKLRILVFKNERSVEVHAPGWKAPRIYPMTAFSGTLGPKLREGDGQIPEGVYGIGYLNPNSSYYLSLKVTYPNASDRARAKADGRTNLGGDIMIHGKAATIGCVPRQGGYNRVRACRRRRDRGHLLSRVGGGDKERLGRHRAIRHAPRPQAGTGTFTAQVVS